MSCFNMGRLLLRCNADVQQAVTGGQCVRAFRKRSSVGQRLVRQSKEHKAADRSSELAVPSAVQHQLVQRPLSQLWRAVAFAGGVSGCAYTAAVITHYESDVKNVRSWMQTGWSTVSHKTGHWREQWWSGVSPGRRLLFAIIGSNALVFCAWYVPALSPIMTRYFMNGFYSPSLCLPMLLSAFSHYSALHLALNMYVLYSFGGPVIDRFFGVEQFSAFYVSAAVISSLAGIAHKAVYASPINALGASGAILACLCYTCVKVPDAQLSIVFLPWFTFSAQTAVVGIVGMDLVGLLAGWRLFDHACHLGGSLFGIWYATWGQQWLWTDVRPVVIRKYLEFTKPPPPAPGPSSGGLW